jgi:small subunit ribosomal protein S21
LSTVSLRNGESQQQLLRRFRKKVLRSGVFGQLRKKRWFMSKNERRRLDKKKGIQRQRRRARKMQSN